MGTSRSRRPGVVQACARFTCLWLALSSIASLPAQETGRTVRHRRVADESPQATELAQAEASIAKQDYAAAEPLLQTVVLHDAANYQAWFDLGFVYNALNRPEESIAAYRKSVAAKPNVFESNLNLGLMLERAGQPDAEGFLRAATALTPTANVEEGRARAWSGLAHMLEGSKPDQAVAAYREVEKLRPKDPEPRLAAGLLYEKLNQFADAEQEYEGVLSIDSSSADALTALANLYMRGRRFDQAQDALRKLLALRPQDPRAHMQMGRMLAMDGRNDEAIAELEVALKIAPGDAGAKRDLAELYMNAKKFDQAEALLRGLIAENPGNGELHLRLGHALLLEHKFADAQQELLTGLKARPDVVDAYGDLAAAAGENQNWELEIRALDARAKLAPEAPIAHFLRATAYDHLRDYKDASLNYHKFLEVANGQFPDQEWQARHRLIAIEPKKKK